MSVALKLGESKHPNDAAASTFTALVGIDEVKKHLVDELVLMLSPDKIQAWAKRHHANGLTALEGLVRQTPLIVLSGDVGCGKTALASCVATPVAQAIDARIIALETPSDIRGGGYVGELSQRITASFTSAAQKAAEVGRGILIIDEADDLVTGRDQIQAHHEDRAGVNVLIKEVDKLAHHKSPLAVILITNRLRVFDPAVYRRASLILKFERPNAAARAAVFRRMLDGASADEQEIARLVEQTEDPVGYTFSDLTMRVGRAALRRAWKADVALSAKVLREVISEVEPSPRAMQSVSSNDEH
jgi:SpoVK/Ycf46/Vps4 family AAA+-type ATPase